jgi:hypothetical protein
MNKKELKQLALEDLQRSGLDESDFKKMKLRLCSLNEAEVVLNSPFAASGYILPYFNIKGRVIDNIRFKFLEELKNAKKKIIKYSQPKGTEPRLYFPPCIDWVKILKDPSISIVFTEGEKKAYKACKEGIPTIGLGGVWSFMSKKRDKELIDDFDLIELEDREIHICYDNDLQTNEDVLKASKAFAAQLNNRRAKPFNKILPFNPYHKIGLDDYLLDHTKEDFEDLEIKEFSNISAVNELDNKVAYIKEIGKFYVFDSGIFVGSTVLKNDVFANVTMLTDGNDVNLAAIWIESKNRREHQRLTYKPGQPQVTEDNEYNLWKGWGTTPKKGSIRIFIKLVNQIFNDDKQLIKWFLDWIAYPIQNPGTKMLTAVLLQSIEQGTGKSSLGLCIGSMYGNNFSTIDDTQLKSTFNEWAINNQFILGDEILGTDRRSESDKIKNLITRTHININKKYSPTYTVPDCINYLFTSNHPDALNIEPDDRRIFVHAIKNGHGFTTAQGKALERFRLGNGCAHLLHYFAYEHKIAKDFDHQARPPMTMAKAELIDHSLTDMERFLVFLKENPEHVLTIDGAPIDRDLFTTSQVIHLYQRTHPKANVTTTAMGKALKKIFNDGLVAITKTTSGTQRLHALRNIDKWKKATHKEMQLHYDRSKIALFEARKPRDKKYKGAK